MVTGLSVANDQIAQGRGFTGWPGGFPAQARRVQPLLEGISEDKVKQVPKMDAVTARRRFVLARADDLFERLPGRLGRDRSNAISFATTDNSKWRRSENRACPP